jgi:hypothetical protein
MIKTELLKLKSTILKSYFFLGSGAGALKSKKLNVPLANIFDGFKNE